MLTKLRPSESKCQQTGRASERVFDALVVKSILVECRKVVESLHWNL